MLEGKKVLIVDDKPDLASVLAKHFSAAGAIVTTANTYETALASAQKDVPDLALCDIDLNGESGIDLIKTLLAAPPPHPFFVIMTNSVNMDFVAEALDLKVVMYIQKAEHDPPEIVSLVDRQYSQHQRELGLSPLSAPPTP